MSKKLSWSLALFGICFGWPLAAEEAQNPDVQAVEAKVEQLAGAIEALRNGLSAISAEKQPAEWASAQNRLGGLLSEAATYFDGAARSQALRQAIDAFEAALQTIDRQEAVQEWSIVSYNLGSAQLDLGEALDGAGAEKALRDAIATLEPIPPLLPAGAGTLRAAVLSHQGDAYFGLGLMMPVEEGRLRIEKAFHLFAEAQEALPAEAAPVQRAMMAYSRARAAAELASRQTAAGASASRQRAIAAYEEAGKTFGREQDVELFVQIQQELGILRLEEAMALGGAEAVPPARAAAESFQRALGAVDRAKAPDLWGSLQGGVGAALLRVGKNTPREDPSALAVLEAAAFAFENLLAVLPREREPQAWAQTQHNLGSTLRELGSRLDVKLAVEPLRKSVAAYRSALEVITRASDEQAWAETQLNLVLALRELASLLEPEEAVDLVDEASERMEEARPLLESLEMSKDPS